MNTNKIEVVDFLINVLKDHEEILGDLIDRVESLLEKNDTRNKGDVNFKESQKVIISIQEWFDFKQNAMNPEFACFEIEDSKFIISAKKGNIVYYYRETIIETLIQDTIKLNKNNYKVNEKIQYTNRKLRSGIEITITINQIINKNGEKMKKISFHLDSDLTKKWISEQLNIKKNLIFNGKIENISYSWFST